VRIPLPHCSRTKRQKHTTGGIPRWSPTLVLVARFSAYVWQSGRDAQFSLTYGRMYSFSVNIRYNVVVIAVALSSWSSLNQPESSLPRCSNHAIPHAKLHLILRPQHSRSTKLNPINPLRHLPSIPRLTLPDLSPTPPNTLRP
jgi:hypothetical protein